MIYEIVAVVKGSHYVLNHKDGNIIIKTYEHAFEQMLVWKNNFNDNRKTPYLFTVMIGETTDIIRTDTIEKMYIREIREAKTKDE